MGEIFRMVAAASDIVGGTVDEVDSGGMNVGDIAATAVQVALWAIGILSVAMIMYGGIKYVMSQGDSAKTTAARRTITYAIVGLIVAIIAYAIVGFIVDTIGT